MSLRLSTGLRNKMMGINTTKVSNGLFTTDATGWTAVTCTATGGITYDTRVGCLRCDTLAGHAYQAIATKIGFLYKVSFDYAQTAGAGDCQVKIGTTITGGENYNSGALTTEAWTSVATYFVATATTTYITVYNTDTVAKYYDNISLISMSRSIQDLFYKGFIRVYSGTQPALADDAVTGVHLVTLYSDGTATGLTFDDAALGVLSKAVAETWSGTCLATGTAGYFRLYTSSGDTITSVSTTEERIDGAIGVATGELKFSSVDFTSGAVITVNTFSLTLPATT